MSHEQQRIAHFVPLRPSVSTDHAITNNVTWAPTCHRLCWREKYSVSTDYSHWWCHMTTIPSLVLLKWQIWYQYCPQSLTMTHNQQCITGFAEARNIVSVLTTDTACPSHTWAKRIIGFAEVRNKSSVLTTVTNDAIIESRLDDMM